MKMCPYCGNQVENKKTVCPYCNKEFAQDNVKEFLYAQLDNQIDKSKGISFGIRSAFTIFILSIFVILMIALPALYIMSKNYPLMFRSNKTFCRDRCGVFSYELSEDEDYCVCDSGDVYNTRSGSLLFNKNNAFNDRFSSFMESDLSKFDDDLVNGGKIVLFIQDEDNYYSIEQLNSLYHFITNNNLDGVKLHYVDPDKLTFNDKKRVKEFVGEKINSSNIYLLLIDNGEVIYNSYKSIFYYDSSEILSILLQNSFIDIER